MINEANEPSSACRLRRIHQVETSTPPGAERGEYRSNCDEWQGQVRSEGVNSEEWAVASGLAISTGCRFAVLSGSPEKVSGTSGQKLLEWQMGDGQMGDG